MQFTRAAREGTSAVWRWLGLAVLAQVSCQRSEGLLSSVSAFMFRLAIMLERKRVSSGRSEQLFQTGMIGVDTPVLSGQQSRNLTHDLVGSAG
jgi:hypothetical protein